MRRRFMIISYQNHEFVDLGLPSGTLWATCNVGASSPEDYGDYFAWGETTTKDTYTADNSLTNWVEISDIHGNAQYDAATAIIGDGWMIPTTDKIQELIDNCTWTWVTLNGVSGFNIKGGNGNYIFLPAAGYYNEATHYDIDSIGSYWSSTPSTYAMVALALTFSNSNYTIGNEIRCNGCTIRPIYSSVNIITFTINNTEYQAEEGMTWQEWVESEYNVDGEYSISFPEDGNYRIYSGITGDGCVIDPTSQITEGLSITLGGAIPGKT